MDKIYREEFNNYSFSFHEVKRFDETNQKYRIDYVVDSENLMNYLKKNFYKTTHWKILVDLKNEFITTIEVTDKNGMIQYKEVFMLELLKEFFRRLNNLELKSLVDFLISVVGDLLTSKKVITDEPEVKTEEEVIEENVTEEELSEVVNQLVEEMTEKKDKKEVENLEKTSHAEHREMIENYKEFTKRRYEEQVQELEEHKKLKEEKEFSIDPDDMEGKGVTTKNTILEILEEDKVSEEVQEQVKEKIFREELQKKIDQEFEEGLKEVERPRFSCLTDIDPEKIKSFSYDELNTILDKIKVTYNLIQETVDVHKKTIVNNLQYDKEYSYRDDITSQEYTVKISDVKIQKNTVEYQFVEVLSGFPIYNLNIQNLRIKK